MINFIFNNLNVIALSVWLVFFTIVAIRFLSPLWVKNISYRWLIGIAVSLHIAYGILATWGQYAHWSKSEFTKILLSDVLTPAVQFPFLLQWLRPIFDNTYGYFAFYSFTKFFLSSFALFFITGLFALFFKAYASYRPALFQRSDIAIIALTLLISGWPGAIVLVPLGFLLAVLIAILGLKMSSFNNIRISTSFVIVAPVAFLYSIQILTAINLWPLLKI